MEPRSYFDSPFERDWTIAEREEFFAGQDAVTGLLNGTAVNNVPFRPNPSIHYYGNELAFSMSKGLECFLYWLPEWKGIHITRIDPPAQGWPIAMYCPICKETTFILSPWAIKPKDGDYFKMENTCGREDRYIFHSAMKYISALYCGLHDAIITQVLPIEEVKRRYPDAPIYSKDK